MNNCIKMFLSSCKICIKHSPSQVRPPVTGTAPSAAKLPMNGLGVDLFDALGKKWLDVVCRFSSYAWLSQLRKTTTASDLESLEIFFLEYGYPNSIRSDGGPQFRSEFAEYCKLKNISHKLASPYNPESNGLAEAAVKSLKSLVIRCDEANEDIRQTVGSGEEHTRSELPQMIKRSHNPHREFRISLHQNPSRDSRGNVDPSHHFWTSPVLSEVSLVSIPQAAAAQEPQGALPQGILEPRRELRDARHGRNIPMAHGSGIWSDCNSRPAWWSLSECDLISERSAPEPLTQYRKIDVAR